MADKIEKTDEQWRQLLTPQQYAVLRQGGTEPAFTGMHAADKTAGTYHCAGCDAPLYNSETKFDSGSGWPSFWDAVDTDAITTETDRGYGMVRTELRCARCDGHLGHLFPDGPDPTGLRHCINSASLRLEPAE